jgi:hypothetical protein
MDQKRTTFAWATAILMLVATGAASASDFGRRYLAVDQSLHGAGTTLDFTMGQAADPIELFKSDKAWEVNNSLRNGWIENVFYDPNDGGYRMYYSMRNTDGVRLALAKSPDGINWTPHTTNVEFAGSNFITLTGFTTYNSRGIFYDANEGDYKFLWHQPGSGNGFNMARSADGINFTTTRFNAFNHKADTGHSMFYDTMNNEYRIYGRDRGDWLSGDQDRRGIPLHRSSTWDGANWTNVGLNVADPVDFWTYTTHPNSESNYPYGAGPDLYAPSIQEYHGQYIGLPAVFHRDPSRVPHTRPDRVTGPIYPMIMHSGDGVNWNMPDLEHPFIDLSNYERVNQWEYATNKTTAEVGQIYPAGHFVEVGDQLYIYYKWRDDTHYEAGTTEFPNPHFDPQADQGIAMQKLRVDGFASMKSSGPAGEWHTGNVEVPVGARGLLVNADVAGSLQVEVRDTSGDPIANLSLADSIAFQGDETSAFMQLSAGQFEQVAGQEVQLRFVVEDGEIYSFSFTTIPEPASLALLGLGGVMLLRRRRIV